MTEAEEAATESVVEEEAPSQLLDFRQRITQNEDESWEDFLTRRRVMNKIKRYLDSRARGYRPATRLVASGLRLRANDVYANRETVLPTGEKAKRRAKNRMARRSRKAQRA